MLTMKNPLCISIRIGLKELNEHMKSVCEKVKAIFECW